MPPPVSDAGLRITLSTPVDSYFSRVAGPLSGICSERHCIIWCCCRCFSLSPCLARPISNFSTRSLFFLSLRFFLPFFLSLHNNTENLPRRKWIVSVSPTAIESSKIWQQTRSKSTLMSSLWWSAPRVCLSWKRITFSRTPAWRFFVPSLTFQLLHTNHERKKSLNVQMSNRLIYLTWIGKVHFFKLIKTNSWLEM